jgi:hypothetical protein
MVLPMGSYIWKGIKMVKKIQRGEEYRKQKELFDELQKREKQLTDLLGLDFLSTSWLEILSRLRIIKDKADRYDSLEKGAK